MKNIEEAMNIIKNAMGNPYLTNCFLYYRDVLNMIGSRDIHVLSFEKMVMLVHEIDGIQKMYYFLESEESEIADIEKEIHMKLSVYPRLEAEFVAKSLCGQSDVLEKLGFRFFKKYIRKKMVVSADFVCKETDEVEIANESDLSSIYQLLYNTFDIMSDHLVSQRELRELLAMAQVLKLDIDGNLAGVLLFETQGKKSYLRALCVAEEFWGRRVGISLMQNYIKRNVCNTKMFYLWVESTNQGAKRLYEKLGYEDDGLRNYIYLYDACQHGKGIL